MSAEVQQGKLSDRIKTAGAHFRRLADRMDELHAGVLKLEDEKSDDLAKVESQYAELEEQVADLEAERTRMEYDKERGEEIVADLEDVRLGIHDLDEVLTKYRVGSKFDHP